ncbi:MAG: hypothetical protein AAFN50_14380 [Pseudomonadota bacterium]
MDWNFDRPPLAVRRRSAGSGYDFCYRPYAAVQDLHNSSPILEGFLNAGNWNAAEKQLLEMQADVLQLPFNSFSMEDHCKRREIDSSLPGFRFEVEVSWMLNHSWVVTIEAERQYLFGLLYRSIFKHIVIAQDDIEIPERFGHRLETRGTRDTRRNWGREDAEPEEYGSNQ